MNKKDEQYYIENTQVSQAAVMARPSCPTWDISVMSGLDYICHARLDSASPVMFLNSLGDADFRQHDRLGMQFLWDDRHKKTGCYKQPACVSKSL